MKRQRNIKIITNLNKFSFVVPLAILILVVIGCDTGPAKIGSLTVSKEKHGKKAESAFKKNETFHITVEVANNYEDTKIRSYMTVAEDIAELKKGEVIAFTDSTENFESENNKFVVEISPSGNGFPSGKYKVIAELLDKDGKKLDSKTEDVVVENDTDPED